MESTAPSTALTKVIPWGQRASDTTEQEFLAKAGALGVQARPLVVSKPTRVFPWIRRNKEFLRVS
jgi:hypothetical protein